MSIAGGFCRMRHYFAQRIVKTLLHITVFRDMAWARASGGTIAEQSRISTFFVNWYWSVLLDFELVLILLCGYHYWTQCLGRPKYCNKAEMKHRYNAIKISKINFSSYNSRSFCNICVCLNGTRITRKLYRLCIVKQHATTGITWAKSTLSQHHTALHVN